TSLESSYLDVVAFI
nr:2-halobenzoate 1,2-dioxygenase component A beta subunit [Pseudomonas cepacia, 2CBS, Peptide Partial, 14 aa] [Burkholderia cepacia]